MKIDPLKENTSQEPVSVAAIDVSGIHCEKLPAGLEFFEQLKGKSHQQIMAALIPNFAESLKGDKATVAIEIFAGLFWGSGVDFDVPLPDWVKTASEKFWQIAGLDFLQRLPDVKPFDLGKIVEMVDLSETSNLSPEPVKALENLTRIIRTESGSLPAKELKEYADGRLAVPKIIEKSKIPSERANVFLFIAGSWRDVEKLGSHAKTHQWLLDHKFISPNTDRGETSKWFREINLPKGQPGRPKRNTDCVKIP